MWHIVQIWFWHVSIFTLVILYNLFVTCARVRTFLWHVSKSPSVVLYKTCCDTRRNWHTSHCTNCRWQVSSGPCGILYKVCFGTCLCGRVSQCSKLSCQTCPVCHYSRCTKKCHSCRIWHVFGCTILNFTRDHIHSCRSVQFLFWWMFTGPALYNL